MTEAYVRPDGRGRKQLRDLKVEVGILDRAEGSSRVHLGKNIAIATVFGPREMHPKHAARSDRAVVRINYRMATFSVDGYKRSYPSRREKEISKVLSEAYEAVVLTKNWPRSVVDVHIEIFQSDGGTRTAAAIAITAALADAGIPMRDLTGGIASGLYEDQVCLDLTGHEDMKGTGDMPILYSPSLDEVSLFQLDGQFTFDQFKEAFYTSMEGIREIVAVIRAALKEKYLLVREQYGVDDEDEEDQQTYDDNDDQDDDQGDDGEEDEEITPVPSEPVGTAHADTIEEKDEQPKEKPVFTAIKASTPETASNENEEVSPEVTSEQVNEQATEPAETVTEAQPEVSEPAETTTETVAEPATEGTTEVSEATVETPTDQPIETTTEAPAEDEESGDDEISSTWFNKPGGELKPMPNSNTAGDEDSEDDESSSVMRDLEYSEEE